MKLYKDGQVNDVQPRYVGREEAKGWSRTPPKPSRKKRESKPGKTSGNVSDSEGES